MLLSNEMPPEHVREIATDMITKYDLQLTLEQIIKTQ